MAGGNTGTYNNLLYLSALNSADTSYTLVYTFRVKRIRATTTTIYPCNYINSGNPIKHTDTSNFGVPQDPNRLAYNNRQDYWHWQFKFLGSYELPWEISTSASVRMTKGEPYGRTGNTTGLTQGTVNLTLEPIGTFFYPTVRLLDLRFSKSFRLASTKLEGLVDIFNVNNSPAILSVNTQTGASFGNVLTTVNPRIVRLGVRWSF